MKLSKESKERLAKQQKSEQEKCIKELMNLYKKKDFGRFGRGKKGPWVIFAKCGKMRF